MRSSQEIWERLFYDVWYCDEPNIFGEMMQCKADAEAGNERAQEYWAKFIAERMKG